MIKYFLLIALCYASIVSIAQNKGIDLADIKSISQAQILIDKNPKLKGKIFTIESSRDTSEIVMPLYNKKSHFTFRIDDNVYKILQIDSALSFRVNYIYLNGEQLTKFEVDSLRKEIISKYRKGTSFFQLAQQYTMDGNITGDTGWFTEGMMVNEFESAVRNHKKGEIFTVDTPDRNWYHVVLKTYDDTYIKKLTILKVNSQM